MYSFYREFIELISMHGARSLDHYYIILINGRSEKHKRSDGGERGPTVEVREPKVSIFIPNSPFFILVDYQSSWKTNK